MAKRYQGRQTLRRDIIVSYSLGDAAKLRGLGIVQGSSSRFDGWLLIGILFLLSLFTALPRASFQRLNPLKIGHQKIDALIERKPLLSYAELAHVVVQRGAF